MTNQPLHDPQTEQLHDRQAALKQRLESAFPPAFPSDPDPEKAIQWIAGNIDKGLCRVFAVHIKECLREEGYKRLLEHVRRRIDDPQLIEALKETLATPSQPDHSAPESLAPLLAGIAFAEIDHILQQAKALGREGNFLHVQCARAGNELIVLSDRDPRYEWILPAVQKRLREELSNLHYAPAAAETQSFDVTCGEPLRFLGFELRCVQGKHGESHVEYQVAEESGRRHPKQAPARKRSLGLFHSLRFVQPCLKWIGHRRSLQIGHDTYRKTASIQAGWRHLPITLYPLVAFLFGWRSPVAWICLTLILVCNWRWPLRIVRPVGAWAWQHKLDTAMGAFVLAVLISLSPLLLDIYANRPREVAASSFLPPGFFLGEYHGDSWWNGEPAPGVSYGLYVPPHFQRRKGPFPLIVFLHGYGERTKTLIFKAGIPRSIASHFGTNSPNGPFEFIAFFPIDPTGQWQADSPEVENVMTALDYIIRRHRIDRERIYLTGLSLGGNGVWELAQAYPEKWSAVAPVSSFISPDVAKVRHLPAWIFHGAKDPQAPVARERTLVRQLQEAGVDVRYTEYPDQQHLIWRTTYDSKELYDWFATKKKTQ